MEAGSKEGVAARSPVNRAASVVKAGKLEGAAGDWILSQADKIDRRPHPDGTT